MLHIDTSLVDNENNYENNYLNNLTIVTSTRDNIIWVEPFLKSFYQTVYNVNIPIIIVDASIDENHQLLLNITKKYKNVKVVTSTDKIKYWKTDWEYGIKECTTKFILHCHIDIIFLLKNWDIILPKLLQTYVIVAGGNYNNITSSFILTTTELLSTAGCDTIIDHNNNILEVGNIINLANKRGKTLLLNNTALHKVNQIQYGDIFSLNNTDIYYHSYYSSRVYDTTCEPIPAAEYISSNISQRNIEEIPGILLKYLDSALPLKDFLIQYKL